ncbi:hypothetical protein SESBI_38508 [Sesbania bispinosa]|nr:hypothetical protein SESBI_38508 [Sesbania bispinosa]
MASKSSQKSQSSGTIIPSNLVDVYNLKKEGVDVVAEFEVAKWIPYLDKVDGVWCEAGAVEFWKNAKVHHSKDNSIHRSITNKVIG